MEFRARFFLSALGAALSRIGLLQCRFHRKIGEHAMTVILLKSRQKVKRINHHLKNLAIKVTSSYNSRMKIAAIHKGRGAVSMPAGRFEKTISDPCDDGWDTLARENTPPPRNRNSMGHRPPHYQQKRFARHSASPFGKSLSRMRARMHLLLRAAFARLPWAFAGTGL